MPPRKSPVYSSSKSDLLSRVSPASQSVALAAFVVAFCFGAFNISAQQQQAPANAAQNQDNAARQDSESSTEVPRSDRQLQIAQQSAGLLQMAKDLKAELDATSSDTLSVSAFRKADAIERFTQTVKAQNKHASQKP